APCDKRVGAHGIITARYGLLGASFGVFKKADDIKKIAKDDPSCYIQEETFKSIKCKPDHIRDPWDPNSKGDSGWYDHPILNRDGREYDPETKTWVKKKKGFFS